MKFALCDDEPMYLEELAASLKEYFLAYPQEKISISFFSDGNNLLDNLSITEQYDIYFLDIIMPGINGIALGHQLRQEGITGTIIYLTSSPEYALDSYRVRAYDYLLKPINKEALFETLDNLLSSRLSKNESFTIIKTKEGSIKINMKDIMYAQLLNRVIHYHLTNGTIIKGLNLRISFTEAVSEFLADSSFYLCGVGFMANLRHITRIEDKGAVFCNKYMATMGVRALRTLKAAWVDYCINNK